ncbi:MAG: DUF4080 domain-containing protein [Treponema sp.]|nr:DUF4080 domain-containing protein [Treponema sp.]
MKKLSVVCTTILIEKSPQALPSGAACVASAIKNSPLTKDLCTVQLKAFCKEDKEFQNTTEAQQAAFMAEELLQLLKKGSSSDSTYVVCFSMYVWNRILIEETASILNAKGVICLVGGPEITAHPEVFTGFDAVTCGEGEENVPEVIKRISENSLKTKIINGKKKPEIVLPLTCDLSKIPSPYLDGTLDPSVYGGALWELARGCPFKCSYCYESKGEKKVRYFPMERIESELKLFAQKKVPQVFVLDPTYNASKKRAIDLINLIAKYTPDTFYYFEARGEFIDRELAHAFTKITCALQLGLQSSNEEILKLVNRPFDKKKFVKNIGYLNEEGVTFGLDLIYGLPGETLKGFMEGIDFAMGLYPNNLELFCLSVLPGTDLYDRAKELNLEWEPNPPYHVIRTDKISPSEIAEAGNLSRACTYFYNDGRAVPWFNTICRSLKIRPSQFFRQFAEYGQKLKVYDGECTHSNIEKVQIDFVSKLYKDKHQEKILKAAVDLIRFNGALSRTQDTGKSETVALNYNSEYLASEYATDLQFFVQNIPPQPNTVETFMNGGFADWRTQKKNKKHNK